MLTKNNGAVSAERNKSLYINLNKDMTYSGLVGVKLKLALNNISRRLRRGEKVIGRLLHIWLATFRLDIVRMFHCLNVL